MFYDLDLLEITMTNNVMLTPAHVERLKSGALADREAPALSLTVDRAAKKQWRFSRVVAGTKKNVELIPFIGPAFSIDEARDWASSLRKAVPRARISRALTRLMRRFSEDGPFERAMQMAELDYIATSRAAQTSIAENYVGLPV